MTRIINVSNQAWLILDDVIRAAAKRNGGRSISYSDAIVSIAKEAGLSIPPTWRESRKGARGGAT